MRCGLDLALGLEFVIAVTVRTITAPEVFVTWTFCQTNRSCFTGIWTHFLWPHSEQRPSEWLRPTGSCVMAMALPRVTDIFIQWHVHRDTFQEKPVFVMCPKKSETEFLLGEEKDLFHTDRAENWLHDVIVQKKCLSSQDWLTEVSPSDKATARGRRLDHKAETT